MYFKRYLIKPTAKEDSGSRRLLLAIIAFSRCCPSSVSILSNSNPSRVDVDGRKKGADFGFFGGSMGLFRSRIMSKLGRFAQWGAANPESVISPSTYKTLLRWTKQECAWPLTTAGHGKNYRGLHLHKWTWICRQQFCITAPNHNQKIHYGTLSKA